MTPSSCLVTGATGYVGGRLVPQLLAQGHRVYILTGPGQITGDIVAP